MKILLDENFPLALTRKLREDGQEVEHIILLGLRGVATMSITTGSVPIEEVSQRIIAPSLPSRHFPARIHSQAGLHEFAARRPLHPARFTYRPAQ